MKGALSMQLETLTAQTSRAHAGAPVHVDPLGRVDTRNAALMLGRSPGTVSNWRVQGIGPKHFTVNGRC
jgi:hypothetical protein